MTHLDHLDISGLNEQASKLRAIDVKGKVPYEELQIGGEAGLLLFRHILVLVVFGRDRYVSDEKRTRFGGFWGEKREGGGQRDGFLGFDESTPE